MKNILFVCNQNMDRSPTAERLFKKYKSIDVKSAGLWRDSETVLDKKLFNWADIIFVMEEVQKEEIERRFWPGKPIINLDIPAVYYYMDKELIRLLKERVKKILPLH